jgi:NAD+ synthase
MTRTLKIALAQVTARVGDAAHNADIVRSARDEAAKLGADLLVMPELHIAGYPPEDLVLNPSFQAECRAHVEQLAIESAQGPAILLGTPWAENGLLYNALALLQGGKIEALRFKHELPNYGVFDEKRVFTPGPLPSPIVLHGTKLGVPICEDIWQNDAVVKKLRDAGAEILLVPNGSPFSAHKNATRRKIAAARVAETGLPLIYLNRFGGQDELVFDGSSFGLNADGTIAFQFPAFAEHIALLHYVKKNGGWHCESNLHEQLPDLHASLYTACTIGLRDYVRGNGFDRVILGLSGGIDSALAAAICVDALGARNVRAVMLPSRYTSKHSLEDAKQCAKNLGIAYEEISIEPALEAALKTLQPALDQSSLPLKGGGSGWGSTSLKNDPPPNLPPFRGEEKENVTEENLQSRLRGVMLMALSNKSGAMLVTTGNKSEMSVGYATLYGDMNGGFNPIKDLYKTQVYELARWKNARLEIIPERIIAKAPSAELRANQTDQDSLPPYPILDAILKRLIEDEAPVSEIVREGYDLGTVKRVENLLALAEYKRRQAPPGVKLSSRNFGRDRRYPITHGFRDPGIFILDDAIRCASPPCSARDS